MGSRKLSTHFWNKNEKISKGIVDLSDKAPYNNRNDGKEEEYQMVSGIKQRQERRAVTELCLGILAVYAILWCMTGTNPFGRSVYDSYLRQALRWIHGYLDLGENPAYLEIAEYGGRYYVSFPPVPSVLLTPFCLLFGERTPDTLIASAVGLLGAVCAFFMARRAGRSEQSSVFWALFVTVGSNFLHVGFRADVWYFAQTVSFTCTLLALFYADSDRLADGWKPWFFLALAVGSRPLQMVYLPLVSLLLLNKLQSNHLTLRQAAHRFWWWTVPALMVGGGLMAFNAARFGNPFQFGHDYLPEFSGPEGYAQFSLSYLKDNLCRLWTLPELVDGRLKFPLFNGCAFWIFSPIFLVFAICFLLHLRQNIRNPALAFALLSIPVHLLLLCCHATLGGWQFGNRYTIDALPVLFFAQMSILKKVPSDLPCITRPLFLWGLGLNLVGTVALQNGWLG